MITPKSARDMRIYDEDCNVLKHIVLLSFETSENLANECVKRGERIKELEATIDEKNSKIINIISKCQCREEELGFLIDAMDFKIDDLKTQLRITKNVRSRSSDDGKLLDDILEIVDTVIERNTEFAHILHTTYNAEQMRDVCDAVAKFRKEHNIKR